MKTKLLILILSLMVLNLKAQLPGETLMLGENPPHMLPGTILTASTDPTGCGLTNGTANAVPGMNSYELYNVTTSTVVGTTQSYSSLPAGNYRLRVVYYTCIKDTLFTLSAPGAPVITLTSDDADNVICPLTELNLTTGGATQYEFAIGGNVVQALSATNTMMVDTLTMDATITVRGVDGSGCEGFATINVTVNPLPATILIASTNPTGCGLSDGTGTAVVGMASYEWYNVGTSTVVGTNQTISGLPAGSYRLTVVTPAGCSVNTLFTLAAPGAPTVTLISDDLDNTICPLTALNLTAGTAPQYEFTIGSTIVQALSATNTMMVDTLTTSTTITVRGVDGVCEDFATINVVVDVLPAVILTTSTNPTGCGLSNGTGTAVAGMASYEWYNVGTSTVVGTNQTISGLPAGSYRLTVVTPAGCSVNTLFTLAAPGAPVITLVSDDADNVICASDLSLIPQIRNAITFTAAAGSQYEFSIGSTIVQALSATATMMVDTLTMDASVTVRGVDGSGCEGFATINVTVNPLPQNQVPTVNTIAVNDNTVIDRGECQPVTVIGLQNTQNSFVYELQSYDAPNTVLDTVTGTGGGIQFAPQPGARCRIIIISPDGCSRPVSK
jgi:hypothetical protein